MNSEGLLSNLQGIPVFFSAAINLLKSFGILTVDEHLAKMSDYLLAFVLV